MFTCAVHYLLNIVLVNNLRLDLVGLCISTNLNAILNFLLITLWIKYREKDSLKEALQMPDRTCILGLKEYSKMGLSACVMLCLEWWTFDMQ